MLPGSLARRIVDNDGITTQDYRIRRLSDPDGIGIMAHYSPALLGLAKHHDPRLIRRLREPSRFCKDPQESSLASRLPNPGAPDRAFHRHTLSNRVPDCHRNLRRLQVLCPQQTSDL